MIESLNDLANLVNDVATCHGWDRASITIQDDGAAYIIHTGEGDTIEVKSLEHLNWLARGADPAELERVERLERE